MVKLLCWVLSFLVPYFVNLEAANVVIPGSLTQENRGTPKQVLQGTIPIQNLGDEVAVVKVTLSDYLFYAKGETIFPTKGSTPRSNALWIQPTSSQIEIAPKTTFSFPYTLQIPDDPTLEGTYWSIFLVEPIEDPSSLSKKEKSLGIQTIIRYGVQIVTHVGNQGSHALKIIDKQLMKEQDTCTFSLSVENTGTLMQTPSLLVEILDIRGKKISKLESPKQRIFPSCSVTYHVDLTSLPQGEYKAMAILDQGESSLFGAQYDLHIQ